MFKEDKFKCATLQGFTVLALLDCLSSYFDIPKQSLQLCFMPPFFKFKIFGQADST